MYARTFPVLIAAATLALVAACEETEPTESTDTGVAADTSTTEADTGAAVETDTGVEADATPSTDTGVETDTGDMTVAPGSDCDCDTDCGGTDANPGVCINGICMNYASEACSASGSADECPAGSRCWTVGSDTQAHLCWPDCEGISCDGQCDSDGSCTFDDASTCDDTCSDICGAPHNGEEVPEIDCPPNSYPADDGQGCYCNEGYIVNEAGDACVLPCESDDECEGDYVCGDTGCEPPPCTVGSCDDGEFCDTDTGRCMIDVGTAPAGPPPTCDVPSWECDSARDGDCSELIVFDPREAHGYWDYPLNGETADNQYRSWSRRDTMMLVRYATAMVACQAESWAFGNGGSLGLGDMSEENGDIPGTSIGSPGHPEGTHRYGHDMDLAYYQQGTSDNRLRAICEHTAGGADQYHCVEAPDLLDVWRSALVIGHMHSSPQLRVIGVDGQAGPAIESAMDALCDEGYLDNAACNPNTRRVVYEVEDQGWGWYRFHHHHFHISLTDRSSAGLEEVRWPESTTTIDPYGELMFFKHDPRVHLCGAELH